MVETASVMIPLGTRAPDFTLLDVCTGNLVSLNDFPKKKGIVIMFICNHCPYVKYIQKKIVEVSQQYLSKGIQFIAISANDAKTYPADGPDEMKKEAEKHQYPFPYLYDETQATAKAYRAACTPDFYLFDENLSCVYRGRFDDATPGNQEPVTGKELCLAIDNLLAGQPIHPHQRPSLGCNIKWKK